MCFTLGAKNIAYIYGDVSKNGDIPSGSDSPFHQMLLTDEGDYGCSIFKNMVESKGHTITQYYDAETELTAEFLNQFDVIIFGLHQKKWSEAEKAALDDWIRAGGSIVIYSDSAAGGSWREVDTQNSVGQETVNNIISQYGMQVTVDQANGVKAYRAGPDATHPIVVDRPVWEGEGVSPVAIDESSGAQALIPYINNSDYKVSGDPTIEHKENITITDPLWAALALQSVGDGYVIASFDRQPMWNNGEGSDIEERDNLELLRRIIDFTTADSAVSTYTLTVTNGSGDGSYKEDTVVNISADPAPAGKTFDSWTGDVSGINNVDSASTSLSMPAANVSVKATYKYIPLPGDEGIAINVGGGAYTAVDGSFYLADDYFTKGGETYIGDVSIAGTEDDVLYQSERYGDTLTCAIPITDGEYMVTLKFAEIYHTASGDRIFDIISEENEILSGVDIYDTVGKNVAYDLSFPVRVDDSLLDIELIKETDKAKLSAIKVQPDSDSIVTARKFDEKANDVDIIEVFPNPAKNYLKVRNTKPGTDVQIIDLSGNIHIRTTYNNEIDISTLKSGVYFVIVKNQSFKIIILPK